jgi:hypothetical protein
MERELGMRKRRREHNEAYFHTNDGAVTHL